MHKYFKKRPRVEELSSSANVFCKNDSIDNEVLPDLPSDPGLRPRIRDYDPNIRERVRRQYYINGPCRPKEHNFKKTNFSGKMRKFNKDWFDEFDWLEYSITKEAAYCLCCYLFKDECGDQPGGDTFVNEGFTNWKKKKKRLREHVGNHNSSHSQAFNKCKDLLKQDRHIENCFVKVTEQAKLDYRLRLSSLVKCSRWLLHHGLPFRGHDESQNSTNRGLFIDLLQFLADNNDEVRKVALGNAPEKVKLTSPSIQKDIVNAAAVETTNVILKELGGDLFAVLIDEARDVSIKEQMAVVLRFVNINGCVVERFLGVKHVSSTTAKSLKEALDDMFSAHSLSISMLRGQGYDGASNMQGEYNGLKDLILKENDSAHYIHCFAHQLQLALVAVAKKHTIVEGIFSLISEIVNAVGGSCKRQDMIRKSQAAIIVEGLSSGEIVSGRGLNQETVVSHPGDTRWGSHYRTLVNLIILFDSIVHVLDIIENDGLDGHKFSAFRLLGSFQSFEFVFTLHFMKSVLGITNELSQALQRKDQDIENAMRLVDISKKRLQKMRDDGWDSLVKEVSDFCEKHLVDVPSMDDDYVVTGQSKRRAQKRSNLQRYRVELFYTVIDMQLQELNYRFNVTNTELLLCISCLNPSNSFASFDIKKLVRMAQLYPKDFSAYDLAILTNQLETFIIDLRSYVDLSLVKGLGDVTRLMVESKRNLTYPLVYKLYTLALILPVATATVERAFSGMKIVKSRLRNRMNDQWLNDNLVVYIEKEMFESLPNDVIMRRFQDMANRKGQM